MATYSNILTRPMREEDVGNVLKYVWRYNYKGKPKEDLDKSHWYLERLRKLYE